MKKINLMIVGSIFIFISACVTINVYFPAAEAEDAAAKIVNKIIGDETQEIETNNPQSSLNILNWFISSAHAEVNINISSPAISDITARMKDRYDRNLKQFLDTQVIGFSNLGFIEMLNEKELGLKDRQKLKKLVADENRDRKALYRELAVANGHPEWEQEIQNVFVKQWQQQAHQGWKYQSSDGSWVDK